MTTTETGDMERLAAALFAATGPDGYHVTHGEWEQLGDAGKEVYLVMVRAVLEELKQPSERMTTRGHADGVRKDMLWQDIDHAMALRLQQGYLPTAWQAMINSILNDESGT